MWKVKGPIQFMQPWHGRPIKRTWHVKDTEQQTDRNVCMNWNSSEYWDTTLEVMKMSVWKSVWSVSTFLKTLLLGGTYLKLEIILGFQFKIRSAGGEKEMKLSEGGENCWKNNNLSSAVAFLGSYTGRTPKCYATNTWNIWTALSDINVDLFSHALTHSLKVRPGQGGGERKGKPQTWICWWSAWVFSLTAACGRCRNCNWLLSSCVLLHCKFLTAQPPSPTTVSYRCDIFTVKAESHQLLSLLLP